MRSNSGGAPKLKRRISCFTIHADDDSAREWHSRLPRSEGARPALNNDSPEGRTATRDTDPNHGSASPFDCDSDGVGVLDIIFILLEYRGQY